MEDSISIEGLTVLETGTLKDGRVWHAVLLEPAHVKHIAARHADAIAALGPNEKTFMLPKTEEYFKKHLAKGDGNTNIAIISGGHIVAQGVVRHPTAADPADGMVDMKLPRIKQNESLMQALSVSPAFQHQGLANIIIGHWIEHAEKHGRTTLMAEIDVKNPPSWNSFLKGGLNLISMGIDPSDGTLVYNAHATVEQAKLKRLTPAFNDVAYGFLYACRLENIEMQQELFQEGRIAIGFNRSAKILIFGKHPPNVGAGPDEKPAAPPPGPGDFPHLSGPPC